jgi:hypothetical protein
MQFWQHIKKMFQCSAAEETENQQNTADDDKEELLLHEVFQHSSDELLAAKAWAATPKAQQLFQKIAADYNSYKNGGHCRNGNLSFLCIPSVNGFILQYSAANFTPQEFVYIFDYLKLQTTTLGYWKHLADKRDTRRNGHICSHYRYYLKPPRQFETPALQVFGNVMLCLLYQDGEPTSIRYSATHYNDRLYAPPLPFIELIEQLTAKSAAH